MRLVRLPYAGLPSKDEFGFVKPSALDGQYVIINVAHIVHIGPFVNKNPDFAEKFGPTRKEFSTVKLVDGSWLYLGLPPAIVAAIVSDDSQVMSPEDWLTQSTQDWGEDE